MVIDKSIIGGKLATNLKIPTATTLKISCKILGVYL